MYRYLCEICEVLEQGNSKMPFAANECGGLTSTPPDGTLRRLIRALGVRKTLTMHRSESYGRPEITVLELRIQSYKHQSSHNLGLK